MSGRIPQGIEVLVLKAAIDPDFKQLLLQQRTAAAAAIGLDLAPAEATMLAAVPAAQLEAIIARASVPQEHRRAFLGQAAAAMLAAVSVLSPAGVEAWAMKPGGSRPDRIRQAVAVPEVIQVISKQTGIDASKITRNDALAKYLAIKLQQPTANSWREQFEDHFNLQIPADDFKKLGTVGDLIDYVERALEVITIISRRTRVDAKLIKRNAMLVGLGARDDDLRKDVEEKFKIKVPAADFDPIIYVGDLIDYVEKILKKKAALCSLPPKVFVPTGRL